MKKVYYISDMSYKPCLFKYACIGMKDEKNETSVLCVDFITSIFLLVHLLAMPNSQSE